VTILLPLLAFMVVAMIVAAAAMALSPTPASLVERRLHELRGDRYSPVHAESPAPHRAILAALKRIGRAAPESPADAGKIRQRLIWSGYRGGEAFIVFSGIRLATAVGFFALLATPVLTRPNLPLAIGAAGFGYLLPSIVLARTAKRRQHRLRLSLPDALDLLVVSVEAGLGLDQAIQRVSEELSAPHPELSDELRLINLELRAGTARADALHNLAHRTGVDDISSLVSMLVQTDKFGTSVAQSLRVHSETLRTKRRQRAEEAAAKTGVKMVFPLVICIFPAIWVVTIGPAAIKFIQILFPMAENSR
jgi:tight adherence protein C